MKRKPTIYCVLMLILYLTAALAQTTPDVLSQLRAVENELSKARQGKVNLVSPKNFQEAMKYFEKAKAAYDKGEKISEIQKNLQKCARNLNLANDVALQGKEVFRNVLQARDDALSARATEYAPDVFQESEQKFFEAARELEKGDVEDARKKAAKVEQAYRQAELIAIKENIVGPVRDLLLKAKDEKVHEYAPLTLEEARRLYDKVLETLNSNRYARSNANEMAEEAAYQVQHAFFVANIIKELRADQSNWEVLIRDFENRLNAIAETLGFQGRYDQGFSRTEKEIILAVKNLQEENRTLKEDLTSALGRADSLEKKIQKYERTVISELERKKEWEEKLRQAEKNFTADEAKVLLSGNQMIIRLYGLTFPSGKTTILPEHFMLLTKVMRSLRLFPNKKIYVHGHTDAQGNDAFNLRLSEERAAAVKAYLEANMGLPPDQIESIGFGETKPIASNETVEGRKLNRRIEIVIDLENDFMAAQ